MKKSDICINEFTDKIQSGQMSRRKFNQILGAAGVSLVMTPMMSHTAAAAAADQATYFTSPLRTSLLRHNSLPRTG